MIKRVEVRSPVAYVPGSPDARLDWAVAEVIAITFFARRRLRNLGDEIGEEQFISLVQMIGDCTKSDSQRRRLSEGRGPGVDGRPAIKGLKEAVELVEYALRIGRIETLAGRISTQSVLDWAEIQQWVLQELLWEFRFPKAPGGEMAQPPTLMGDAPSAATPPAESVGPEPAGNLPTLPEGFQRLQAAGLAAWAHFGPTVTDGGEKPSMTEARIWIRKWLDDNGMKMSQREIEILDSALFSPRRGNGQK